MLHTEGQSTKPFEAGTFQQLKGVSVVVALKV